MRRRKPPSTLQGIQSTGVAKANNDSVSSNCKASSPRVSISRTFSPRVSISQNSTVESHEINDSDLFSIEIEKHNIDTAQYWSWFNGENSECVSEMPVGKIIENTASVESKGYVQETWIAKLPDDVLQATYSDMAPTNGLAGASTSMDSICSGSSQMTETPKSSYSRESSFSGLQVLSSPMDCLLQTGHTSHHNNPILSGPFASSTVSRTSSVSTCSVACNSSDYHAFGSTNYSETAHRFPLSNLKELVDISSATKHIGDLSFRNIAVSKYPGDMQENVKVISVQPREAHTLHFLRTLLSPEGMASDQYSLFSQQQQNTVGKLYPAQVMDNVVGIIGLEEEGTKILGTIVNVDTTSSKHSRRFSNDSIFLESHVFNRTPSILLDKENVYPSKHIERIFTSGPFLCSVCKQVSPDSGKRPLRFSHEQLQFATDNFSSDNLLGEDEFGLVYKGLLKEGQLIAIKQIKQPSLQGDEDCRLEIELLSCAQHRNLVILLGYCDEENHFMLVYEYVCHKSLSWHLAKDKNPNVLEWWARQKIAVGAARGLRYLHEECRVGCIVHRDMRPKNILLTHDFQPMVGNFGLARSQQTKDDSIETQVVGTLGYLAPECARTGTVSWKSDVYAFGVVLLELITGRTAIDSSLELGQQNLVEWARPLLLERKYHELLDPQLENSHDSFELVCMVRAASLCVTSDFSSRPRMSQVLHILEGESGNDDSPPVEHAKSETLSGVQFDLESRPSQKLDQNETPKPQSQQQVSSSSNKPRRKSRKSKRPPMLTYDEMLQ